MPKKLDDDELYRDAESVLDEIMAYLARVKKRNETAYRELEKSLNRAHPSAGEKIRARLEAMGDRCHEVGSIEFSVGGMVERHRRVTGKKP
jgi:hypothetical protein